MSNVRIGIDPGLSGAIAVVGDDFIYAFDMPIEPIPWAKTSKYKNRVAVPALIDLLSDVEEAGHEIQSMTIEIVSAMPKQGVSSTWHFAAAFSAALAVMEMHKFFAGKDCEYKAVLPSQWKKKYGLINMPKDAARLACIQMYPYLADDLLKRKKDVDRADAILIATY